MDLALSDMEAAALALLHAKAFPFPGCQDANYKFPGGHEIGCIRLMRGKLAESKMGRYSFVCKDLSNEGKTVERPMYRLTDAGRIYATELDRNLI